MRLPLLPQLTACLPQLPAWLALVSVIVVESPHAVVAPLIATPVGPDRMDLRRSTDVGQVNRQVHIVDGNELLTPGARQ
jgi:hypothetical protein